MLGANMCSMQDMRLPRRYGPAKPGDGRIRYRRIRFPADLSSWTPGFAYAAGLVATDGSLSKDWKTIAQTSKDRDLLVTFKSCIGAGQPITWCRDAYRVQIVDVGFYDWLRSIGLRQRKSLSLVAVSVPEVYFLHLVRGLMDGDGTIRTPLVVPNPRRYPEHRYQQLTVQFLSASSRHIRWLERKLRERLGIRGWIGTERRRRNRTMHFVRYAKHASIVLLKALYEDASAPRLERKWRRWNDFCLNGRPTRVWTRRSVEIG